MPEFKIHLNDTRTVLPGELKQPNEAGVNTVVDLTGLTVTFKMVDQYGTAVIAETATGVTVTDATNGKCQYDFSSSGVDTAGLYYGYFIVTDGGESDHFPVTSRELTILIQADA